MCTKPFSYAWKNPRQTGVTLIELIVAIVIISASIVGILGVMTLTTGHSADTLIRKQAIVIAESLMEEIQLRDVSAVAATTTVTASNRLTVYHTVSDYNGFSTSGGITDPYGSAITGLSSYNISPAVIVAANSGGDLGVAAASAVRITVSVTDPVGNITKLDGYRASY